MSTEFAVQILKLTDSIKGHYSLSNQLEPKFPEILPTRTAKPKNKSNILKIFEISEHFDLIFLWKYSRIILYFQKKVCDMYGTE